MREQAAEIEALWAQVQALEGAPCRP